MKPLLSVFPSAVILSIALLSGCAGTAPENPGAGNPGRGNPAAGNPGADAPADGGAGAEKAGPQAPPAASPRPDSPPQPGETAAALIRRLSAYPPLPAAREIALRVFPQNAAILELRGGELVDVRPVSAGQEPEPRTRLTAAEPGTRPAAALRPDTRRFITDAGALALSAPGFLSTIIPLPPPGQTAEVKLERPRKSSEKIGELPTARQPKSVRFSPDGRYIFTAHLADSTAITQYSVQPFRKIRDWHVPPQYREESGFVETLILPERRELWLSQMNGSRIHIFNLESGAHLAAVPISGRWPKVLLAAADESRVYVSCWKSGTIVEIDTALRSETRSIPTGPAPRGMAFGADETELLVSRFGDSSVERINLQSGRTAAVYNAAPSRIAAMRHIVHDPLRARYYITAMGADRVYRLSEDGRWLGHWDVGANPNTAALTPDGRRLIVASRGPNNPDKGYLFRGYEYGKVFFIDLESGIVDEWIWGRDQPTGLAVDSSGRYLAFTDMLSDNLELYRLF